MALLPTSRSTPAIITNSPGTTLFRVKQLSFPAKRTTFLLIAITSALLVLHSARVQLSSDSLSSSAAATNPLGDHQDAPSGPFPTSIYTNHENHDKHDSNFEDPTLSHADEDEEWRFSDDDGSDEDEEDEENGEENVLGGLPGGLQQNPYLIHNFAKTFQNIVPSTCPNLFFTTTNSFELPSHSSSSTVSLLEQGQSDPSPAMTNILQPDQVHCRPIPSQLQDHKLAFCISKTDCSRGFIQIVQDATAIETQLQTKVSKSHIHDAYFRRVAGPNDYYFVLEGAQKLALSAHLVSEDLMVKTGQLNETKGSRLLVYRADFKMTLPGPVQISGTLAYEKFRATRENRPGIWPQWTHSTLVGPSQVVNSATTTPEEPISDSETEPSTQFNICPSCELDSFVSQLATFRDTHFEQCDRMAPVRGAYWREDLAMRVYSDKDRMNKAPGAGANYTEPQASKDKENPSSSHRGLTRGWRFVPNGCTMTTTASLSNPSSQNPFQPICDSVASPGADMRPLMPDGTLDTNKTGTKNYPRRKILFTGDSQVRTTFNAILNYYRPMEMSRQKYAFHDEFIPGRESTTLYGEPSKEEKEAFPGLAKTVIQRNESDTEIELVYKADQFLDYLVQAKEEDLDEYDTIYFNLGQWPASGPVAGGQWSTNDLIERFEKVVGRLSWWRQSREEKWRAARAAEGVDVKDEQPPATIVIWAGQNAFPMRTDASIRVKGDWRTNARLGYWDDLVEGFSQTEGAWFRRMNSWQITFPMLDQVTDKAHFQQTDAIDALMTEALYKLDFCSRLQSDVPYSVPLESESA